jgi:hypothetical protein
MTDAARAKHKVSVVMSVYNGASHLAETMDSVLTQTDCDFEMVVVNDGSTDATGDILNSYDANDDRLRVLHQNNVGLTLALARGCAEACGEFIARQDSGDISLPGRLSMQRDFLIRHPTAVMTASAVQFTGPEREALYRASKPMLELDRGLRQFDIERLKGPPHHGATMFRRDAYLATGGYRLPFAVAQDIDLWLRLSELGECLGMPELLYEARHESGSVSSRRRDEQFQMGRLAIECAIARRSGTEAALLEAFKPLPTPSQKAPSRRERARFHYFVASCLRGHDPAGARRYYRLALQDNPFHLKALFRCITDLQ